jgi:hypothetical protein
MVYKDNTTFHDAQRAQRFSDSQHKVRTSDDACQTISDAKNQSQNLAEPMKNIPKFILQGNSARIEDHRQVGKVIT